MTYTAQHSHPHHPLTPTLCIGIGLWAACALFAVSLGLLDDPPRVLPPVLIWSQTIAVVVGTLAFPKMRAWLRAVDLKHLNLIHIIRFAYGSFFLFEVSHNRLNPLFAYRAAPGDMATGLLFTALFALSTLYVFKPATKRRVYLGATLFGFADMLFVFFTAMSVLFSGSDPSFVRGFVNVPYCFLPTLILPLILSTHILTLVKLLAPSMRQPADEQTNPLFQSAAQKLHEGA